LGANRSEKEDEPPEGVTVKPRSEIGHAHPRKYFFRRHALGFRMVSS